MGTLLLEDPSVIQQMDWAPECVVLSQWCQRGLFLFFPSRTRSLFSEHQKNYVACIQEAMSCKEHISVLPEYVLLDLCSNVAPCISEDCISSGPKGAPEGKTPEQGSSVGRGGLCLSLLAPHWP